MPSGIFCDIVFLGRLQLLIVVRQVDLPVTHNSRLFRSQYTPAYAGANLLNC